MSKAMSHRKETLTKHRDSSVGERFSDDDEAVNIVYPFMTRRRPCYELIQKEKQQFLTANDLGKTKNQLAILYEILSHKQNSDMLIQRSNKIDKTLLKTNHASNEKNHSIQKIRPTSNVVNRNQSTEEDDFIHLNRSNEKHDKRRRMIRSSSLSSQPNNIRSRNKVSFITHNEKSNDIEPNLHTSPNQLKKLFDRLSSELNDLESMTNFKSNKNDLSSNTCSSALITALITLTGHVKQYIVNSNEKQELNNLKDQLSFIIKSQLDFQQKIEHQMITLQTMMQTICQLINNEIIPNKKCQAYTSRNNRDQTDLESHQNWLNNVQRPYILSKDKTNAMDQLLMLAHRMNNVTPINSNLNHQITNNPSMNLSSTYLETLQASNNQTRPTTIISTNDIDIPKQIQHYQSINQEPCSSIITPVHKPSTYNMYESGLFTGNSLRNEISAPDETSNILPFFSKNETVLEKILQERLRLVQQMTELNKQHNMTQEELANLELKTRQSRITNENIVE
ncbi:unnamed protein product [Adineta steineri]|uniref:Uncharacterized protein n=1 Tax=Adineta steineri TaxID=433720 RepID=A0A814YWF0_9BILA|nr:unnamed protein product [Adineta steineri]CAF3791354.1 unnamed protein product [Adineta steineri]